jgi:hypothetical protein
MRKLLFLLLTAAALAGAGMADSAGGPAAALSGLSHVYGGGEFGPGCFGTSGVCFGAPRAFAIDVHGDGRNFAIGTLEYGVPGVSSSKVKISCATVAGNRVVVGGIITESTNPAFVGAAAALYLVDNGTVASATPDQSSPIFIGTPGATGDFPATFPAVCLPPSGTPEAPAIFQDVHGDVVIGTGI